MKPWFLLIFLAGCPGGAESDTGLVDTDPSGDTDETDPPAETDTDSPVLAVVIDAPADGVVVGAGDVVTFEASSTWEDGSAASTAYVWTSSLEGAIGSGASLPWAATVGTHTITVNGTAEGDQDDASITVVVEPREEQALTRFGEAHGFPAEGVTWHDLDVMADGRVIGASSAGLLVFDGLAAWKTRADGLGAEHVRAVLEDSFGEVWVGYTDAEDLHGERITLDAAGAITVNSSIHITRTGEISALVRFAEQPYGAGAGDVWLGSNEGMCVYDRDLDVYLEHQHPTHPHGRSRGVTFTADGDHWNGDEYQLSRWSYDHDGGVSSGGDLIGYDKLFSAAEEESIYVRDLASDGVNVFIASELFGYGVLDSAAASMVDGFTVPAGAPAAAYAVEVDRDGLVWIGASDGLWIHDPATGELARAAAAEITEPVQAIALDDGDGSLWLATPTALYRALGAPE